MCKDGPKIITTPVPGDIVVREDMVDGSASTILFVSVHGSNRAHALMSNGTVKPRLDGRDSYALAPHKTSYSVSRWWLERPRVRAR